MTFNAGRVRRGAASRGATPCTAGLFVSSSMTTRPVGHQLAVIREAPSSFTAKMAASTGAGGRRRGGLVGPRPPRLRAAGGAV